MNYIYVYLITLCQRLLKSNQSQMFGQETISEFVMVNFCQVYSQTY